MIAQWYSGQKTPRYSIGRELGRGGEGAVFEITEDSSLVAKLYFETLEAYKSDKLAFMTSIEDAEISKYAAWPIDILKDQSGKISGFIMKRLVGYVPLHMLFSPKDRKDIFPDKGYNFLVHVAKNLAIAFYALHQRNIVMGDVNEANILVNVNGMIAIIDCDSFQIKNGNRFHFCEVGVPRYTAPELLEKGSFENVIRNSDTDSFALATLIFQLLFMGRTPFTGINPTKEDIDEEKAIKSKEFAYSIFRTNKKLQPAKHSLNLKDFPNGIIHGFHAAFEGSQSRPSPKSWVTELDTFSRKLVKCQQSRLHYFPANSKDCPWCELKKRGVVFFLDDIYSRSIPDLNNIDNFVNGFRLEKIEIKSLTEKYYTTGMAAGPIETKFKAIKSLHWLLIAAICATAIVISLKVESWGFIFCGGIALWVFSGLSPTSRLLKSESNKRKETFEKLKLTFKSLVTQHNNSNEIRRYNNSAATITDHVNNFRNLPVEFNRKKKAIEEKNYNLKYHLYLQRFDVRNYAIPSFAAAKKSLILSNGIRTAADVSKLDRVKINGIGPKNIQILKDWQRHMGSNFTYIPDFETINHEVNVLNVEISTKRLRLENNIKSEYKLLVQSKSILFSSLAVLEQQYQDLSKKVAQADLDYQAFQKFYKI